MNTAIIEHLANDGRLDRIFIGGEWVLPAGQARSDVIDPSTEEPVAEIALGNAQDVATAVAAARLGDLVRELAPEQGRASRPRPRPDPGAGRIRSGQVHINNPPWSADAPFGGYKRSGNGCEYGVEGLEEYLETKAILGYLDGPAPSVARGRHAMNTPNSKD